MNFSNFRQKSSTDVVVKKYPLETLKQGNLSVGKMGEELARVYYLENGYTIVSSNVHKRFGEIDVIALKKKQYAFCEVKTRASSWFGEAVESLPWFKRKRMWRMAQYYALKHKIDPTNFRVDFIAIQVSGGTATLKHFSNIEV